MDNYQDLEGLHHRLCILMNEIHNICIENNIKYTLMGGSLLGAVRHKGFIPWDDDIDMGLLWDDYKRFLDVVIHLKHDWLGFDLIDVTENYWLPFLKIYDKRTTFWETDRRRELVKGIFVDVFPIVYAGNTKEEALKEFRHHRLLQAFLRRRGYRFHTGIIREFLFTSIGKMFSNRFWMNKIIKQYERLCRTPLKYVSDMDGSEKGVVPAYLFDDTELLPFEEYHFCCIKKAGEYLSLIFGNDYMQLPPIELRDSHHIIYMNMDLPYKDFVKIETNE